MPKERRLSRASKSEVFDETYFKGKKGSYEKGGYDFDEQYAASVPLARTFYEIGVRKALDIGCATGPLVRAFIDTGIDAYGVDVSEWAVRNSPIGDRLSWLDIDEDEIPFQDGHFDLVAMKFVVEHLYHPEKAFGEVFRVLKPQGYLFIETDKPLGDFSRQVGHVNIRSRRSWLDLLEKAGFKETKIQCLRFTMIHLYKKACSGYGPLARKLLLQRIGFFGRMIRLTFKIVTYPFEESAHLLLVKAGEIK